MAKTRLNFDLEDNTEVTIKSENGVLFVNGVPINKPEKQESLGEFIKKTMADNFKENINKAKTHASEKLKCRCTNCQAKEENDDSEDDVFINCMLKKQYNDADRNFLEWLKDWMRMIDTSNNPLAREEKFNKLFAMMQTLRQNAHENGLKMKMMAQANKIGASEYRRSIHIVLY